MKKLSEIIGPECVKELRNFKAELPSVLREDYQAVLIDLELALNRYYERRKEIE